MSAPETWFAFAFVCVAFANLSDPVSLQSVAAIIFAFSGGMMAGESLRRWSGISCRYTYSCECANCGEKAAKREHLTRLGLIVSQAVFTWRHSACRPNANAALRSDGR